MFSKDWAAMVGLCPWCRIINVWKCWTAVSDQRLKRSLTLYTEWKMWSYFSIRKDHMLEACWPADICCFYCCSLSLSASKLLYSICQRNHKCVNVNKWCGHCNWLCSTKTSQIWLSFGDNELTLAKPSVPPNTRWPQCQKRNNSN